MILSNTQFYDLVTFYNLEKYVLAYKLFNPSKYINSYHGYNHVKNIVCAIHFLEGGTLPYFEARSIMIGGIFHDFGYLLIEDDALNIINALKAIKKYVQPHEFEENYQIVHDVIIATQYPYYDSKKMLNIINDNNYSAIIRDCDQSMPLFNNYPKMVLELFINEMKCDSTLIMNNTFLEKLTFKTTYFNNLWKENKNNIIKNIDQMIKYYFKYIYKRNLNSETAKRYVNMENKFMCENTYEIIPSNYCKFRSFI
jgi:hypothetical protein